MNGKAKNAPVGLGGNLRDFGVAEVLQLVGQQRKSGILEVKRKHQPGLRLVFDEGRVVLATPVGKREFEPLGEMLVRSGFFAQKQLDRMWKQCEERVQSLRDVMLSSGFIVADTLESMESLLTRETIFNLLQCSEGEFSFSPQPVHHNRDASSLLGAEQILMDGLRVTDEWCALQSRLPNEANVYKLAKDSDEIMSEFESHIGSDTYSREEALQILELINGERTVREVIDRSMLGTFEGMRILIRFVEWGVLERCGRSANRVELDGEVGTSRFVGLMGRVAASIVPFVLLASLVAISEKQPLLREAPVMGVAVVRSQMTELQVDLETLRLKRALATGRWLRIAPRDLKNPETFALRVGVPRPELISSANQPYYYVQEGRGWIPLAPVRDLSPSP